MKAPTLRTRNEFSRAGAGQQIRNHARAGAANEQDGRMLTFLDQGLKLFLKPRERIFAEPRRSRASSSSGPGDFFTASVIEAAVSQPRRDRRPRLTLGLPAGEGIGAMP